MPNYPDTEGGGLAFEQVEKRNPKAPDFKGTFLIDGKPMELACWWREGESAKGKWRALSFKVGPPRPKPEGGQAPAPPPAPVGDEPPPDDAPPTNSTGIPF